MSATRMTITIECADQETAVMLGALTRMAALQSLPLQARIERLVTTTPLPTDPGAQLVGASLVLLFATQTETAA